MIRNFYAANEAEQLSSTFRGTEASVGRHMTDYMDRLRRAPHEVEKEINKVEHAVVEDAKGVEHKAKHVLSPSSSTATADDEDEGWTSDRSERPHASMSGSTDERKRSKSPKQKHSSKPVGAVPRKGRRRNSMRKGMLGRAYLTRQKEKHQQRGSSSVFEDSDGEEDENDDDDGRGRSSTEVPSRGSGSLRNLRIDTIRRGARSRDDSPNRSIRFADEIESDENRSGSNTPRSPILQESSPDSPSHGPVEEPESAQRVTFELPEPPK